MKLIYDCEIIKCIPPKPRYAQMDWGRGELPVDLDPDLQYCNGWDDHANMGISVAGWTFLGGDAVIADFSNLAEVEFFRSEIAKASQVIGFNSRNFDDRLMAANGITITTTYDLLEEVRIAAGFEAHFQSVPKGFSYSLDAIARANGTQKTGNGALASKLWQQGKKQEVIDYCLNDVRITERLLNLGLAGQLIDPNTGELLQLRQLP